MTSVTIPTLQTERLSLRAPIRADFEPFQHMFASDRMAFTGGPLDRMEAYATFSNFIGSWLLSGFGMWSITDKHSGTWLGEVTIAQPDHFPEPEIGWSLAEDAEGKGYAHEAARAALDWAKGKVAPLVSYIDPNNARSIALAQRLGATRDIGAERPRGETAEETHVYRHWGQA